MTQLATPEDCEAILTINQSVNVNTADSKERGFLIYRYEESKLLPLIKMGRVIVAKAEGVVVGYVVFQPWNASEMEETRSQIATVRSPKLDLFHLPSLIWISQVGVAFSATRMGVGRALYHALFSKFPGHAFAATIAEVPFENRASATLHQKLGFERIASYESDDFYGVTEYRSGVYLRRAERF